MNLQDRLTALEREFWGGDAAFYDEHLSDDALMVFPEPVSIMNRDETVRSIADAPRWSDVRMEDVRMVPLTATAAVLTYRATARRGDDAPYLARASSVYVERDGMWTLAFHQQGPLGAEPPG
jgi:hypothetical protein